MLDNMSEGKIQKFEERKDNFSSTIDSSNNTTNFLSGGLQSRMDRTTEQINQNDIRSPNEWSVDIELVDTMHDMSSAQ